MGGSHGCPDRPRAGVLRCKKTEVRSLPHQPVLPVFPIFWKKRMIEEKPALVKCTKKI
jgi:hypothetical protein